MYMVVNYLMLLVEFLLFRYGWKVGFNFWSIESYDWKFYFFYSW